jgi:hypothetical protein
LRDFSARKQGINREFKSFELQVSKASCQAGWCIWLLTLRGQSTENHGIYASAELQRSRFLVALLLGMTKPSALKGSRGALCGADSSALLPHSAPTTATAALVGDPRTKRVLAHERRNDKARSVLRRVGIPLSLSARTKSPPATLPRNDKRQKNRGPFGPRFGFG